MFSLTVMLPPVDRNSRFPPAVVRPVTSGGKPPEKPMVTLSSSVTFIPVPASISMAETAVDMATDPPERIRRFPPVIFPPETRPPHVPVLMVRL
ncbi:MAG: hypothetical protein BWY88_01118 [Synergistetes bacterium ADurb.Bin520]|nr:MAG: hypothetical protein BWY88_01118 [Synergistetes bacterium ADurb.Bin520]